MNLPQAVRMNDKERINAAMVMIFFIIKSPFGFFKVELSIADMFINVNIFNKLLRFCENITNDFG